MTYLNEVRDNKDYLSILIYQSDINIRTTGRIPVGPIICCGKSGYPDISYPNFRWGLIFTKSRIFYPGNLQIIKIFSLWSDMFCQKSYDCGLIQIGLKNSFLRPMYSKG